VLLFERRPVQADVHGISLVTVVAVV
jgi:hypothetical protein